MMEQQAERATLTITDDGIGKLRLTRGDGNAIDAAMVHAIYNAVEQLEATDGLRAVLICGDGPSFCVGGDLGYLSERFDRLRTEFVDMIGHWHDVLPRLADLPVPVVTAVQGGAAGGGLGLLWVADFVVAADDLKLVSGFSRLGFTGDGGSTWHLPRLVGYQRAREFLMRSTPLSADEALSWGLVSQVVPTTDLDRVVNELVSDLAAGPTWAYGGIKSLLLQAHQNDYREQMAAERRLMLQGAARSDVDHGMKAFLSGQRPQFDGQ